MEECLKVHTEKVAGLSRQKLANLNTVLSEYDQMYMEDPLQYVDAYEAVAKKFPRRDYPYGTVGALFVGCSQTPSLNSGCQPTCAEALKLPYETLTTNSHCLDAVVTVSTGGMRVGNKGNTGKILLYLAPKYTPIREKDLDKLYGLGDHADIMDMNGKVTKTNVPVAALHFLTTTTSDKKIYALAILILFGLLLVAVLIYMFKFAR